MESRCTLPNGVFSIAQDADVRLIISAIVLVIESIFICVLYSVLCTKAFRDAELAKRSGISFLVAVAGIAMFAADRSECFQRLVR
jgi:hypothetical protein